MDIVGDFASVRQRTFRLEAVVDDVINRRDVESRYAFENIDPPDGYVAAFRVRRISPAGDSYTVLVAQDGSAACDCWAGMRFARSGHPGCKHAAMAAGLASLFLRPASTPRENER